MPGALPPGDPAPADGALPAAALAEARGAPLSVYVHVPFCTSRCGYCDFNTYTAAELGRGNTRVSRDGYADLVLRELDLARATLGDGVREVATIFFGGGTPTLLPPQDLGRIVAAIDQTWGIAANAEISTETNPESVTPAELRQLLAFGFNRISIGMQSSALHVLATLDRVHTPGGAIATARAARDAGFERVSLDLIYGAPGESVADWQTSLTDAAAAADHVSAYALIVEPGTRMAAAVKAGRMAAPDDDQMADKYLLADDLLSRAGFSWYEISNWARAGQQCQHNLAYWQGQHWWGFGPGAHSHVGGVRWWNVKHPSAYAARVLADASPAQAREVLDEGSRHLEQVMLRLRLRSGLDPATLSESEARRVPGLLRRRLLARDAQQLRLTRQGRLLADAVIRELLD